MQRNSVRGPGSKNIDLALSRDFQLRKQPGDRDPGRSVQRVQLVPVGQPTTAINSRDLRSDYDRVDQRRRASSSP